MNSSLGMKSIRRLVLTPLVAVLAFALIGVTVSAQTGNPGAPSNKSDDKSEKKKEKEKDRNKEKSKSVAESAEPRALGVTPAALTAASLETVMATVETDPVPNGGDAADDPAIWVNPNDPAQSVIIG